MRVLITGASGYVGSQLALELARSGHVVHALVRDPRSPHLPRHENLYTFIGDVNDPDSIAKAVAGCEQVYHTAAIARLHPPDPSIMYQVNLEGTKHMLEQSLWAGVRKLVFTSSCSVYSSSGDNIADENTEPPERFANHYERSKFLADQLVGSYAQSSLETVTVHLTRVFGPGPETHSMSANQVIRRFARGQVCLCPRPVSTVSNYTFIDDVVRGHILAMSHGRSGERYILGGENLSYQSFFEILTQTFGKKGRVVAVPRSLAYAIGLAGAAKSFFGMGEATFKQRDIATAYSNRAFSSEKAVQQLGYSITPFATAVERKKEFYQV